MAVLFRWWRSGKTPRRMRSDVLEAPIVVAPMTAMALRVPSAETIAARTLELERNQWIDRDELIARLVASGYSRMPVVEERGELAVRGGIVDFFPPHAARPVRIEMLGDEIESLREFDPASQRSQEKLDNTFASPPRELVIDRAAAVDAGDALRARADEQGVPQKTVDELVDQLLRGHLPPGAEALAPLLDPNLGSAFDLLPDDTLVAIDEPDASSSRLEHYRGEAQGNYAVALDAERLMASPEALFVRPDDFEASLTKFRPVRLERMDIEDREQAAERIGITTRGHDELRRALAETRSHDRALTPLAEQLDEWMREGWRIVIACSALSAAERLRTLLKQYGVETKLANDRRPLWRWSAPGSVEVRVAGLAEGFAAPDAKFVVVGEEEIVGKRERRRRSSASSAWKDGTAVDGLSQLAPGDFLVHADHGIGIYRGLVEMKLAGVASELLRLEYEGGDRLFLPVHRLNLVQRYGGSDGATPRIDRLGGQTWEKAKKRVKKSLRNMATQLLSVHAAREVAPGVSFSPRDAYFKEFEAAFPFEETPDQADAIEDVLADMQRGRPMDRLVCGDVGYGKTEVAARGAFRAVCDGKQVAVLVPTTVLCQQHAETLAARFQGYPIRVESLSRFTKPKASREIVEGMKTGAVDVVVGTHRLLAKNVEFRDLGLLVVDEEHRFGVTHKERIKQLKKTVDVLTLTATPIPRTLQLAFSGLRELSVIKTPPVDRLAVRTQVCRSSDDLIREAILREVRRGGQVFFVHNRVRTIGGIAEMLERVVPDVKVIVAHGQMKEGELEEKMVAFAHGEADVLLCTTIIESGIDIPRANTIIINRADALGLAQLYQLRGRVGRSSQRAYAYLLIPGSEDSLASDAQRRLEAIQDLSELGAGFRLANMDLEIRGAGNLLGAEQSGNLLAVGYETYMEMLEETIEELRGKIREHEVDPEIRLPIEARLPDGYVADVSQRLVLYKRLAGAQTDEQIDRVRDELLDRFGPLPPEAENLLGIIRLKARARALGITAIDWLRGEVVLSIGEAGRIDPKRLVTLLGDDASGIRMTPDQRICKSVVGARSGNVDAATLLDAAGFLLSQIEGREGAQGEEDAARREERESAPA